MQHRRDAGPWPLACVVSYVLPRLPVFSGDSSEIDAACPWNANSPILIEQLAQSGGPCRVR